MGLFPCQPPQLLFPLEVQATASAQNAPIGTHKIPLPFPWRCSLIATSGFSLVSTELPPSVVWPDGHIWAQSGAVSLTDHIASSWTGNVNNSWRTADSYS